MTTSLFSLDQLLLTVPADADSVQLRGILTTLVYANAAARASSANAPAAERPGKFCSTWMNTLGRIGWVLSTAGTSSQQSSSTSGPALALGIATANLVGNPGASTIMARLLSVIEAGSDEALVQLWWKTATAIDGYLFTAMGELDLSGPSPTCSLNWVTLPTTGLKQPGHGLLGLRRPFEVTGPESMQAMVDASTVQVEVRGFQAQLDSARLAPQLPGLEAQLGDKFFAHLAGLPGLAVQATRR